MQTFKPIQALRVGVQKFFDNIGLFVGAYGLYALIQLVITLPLFLLNKFSLQYFEVYDTTDTMAVSSQITTETMVMGMAIPKMSFIIIFFLFLITRLILIFITSGLYVGLLRINLNIIDGKPAQISDLFSGFGHILTMFFASILLIIGTTLGLMALIIPGIIFMVRSVLYGYFVVDRQLSAYDAIKKSFHVTKGNFWCLVGFMLLGVLLPTMFASIISLIVRIFGISSMMMSLGLLVSILLLSVFVPSFSLALAYIYRKLTSAVLEQPFSQSQDNPFHSA